MITPEQRSLLGFAFKVLTYAAVIAALCSVVIILSADPDSFAKSLETKLALLRDAPSPRLVVIGGSGSALGFDSALFEKKTGLHPVNTGVYAALGMRFIADTALPHIRKGDVVLVLPEYELLHQPPWGDGYIMLETLQANPSETAHILNFHTIAAIARAFPIWLRNKAIFAYHRALKMAPKTIYSLSNVNGYGDLSSADHARSLLSPEDMEKASVGFVRPHGDPQSLATLKSFVASAQAAGARVFVSWAPLSDAAYALNKAEVASRADEMAKSFGPLLVGKATDFIYPSTDFYDAPTHLNLKGRARRTEELITLLKAKGL